MESKDNKNAILAVFLSGMILFGWQYFFGAQPYEKTISDQVVATDAPSFVNFDKTTNTVNTGKVEVITQDEESKTIIIENTSVRVEVNNLLEIKNFYLLAGEKNLTGIFKEYKNNLAILLDKKQFKPSFTFEKISNTTYKITDQKLNLTGSISLLDDSSLEIMINSTKTFLPQFFITSIAQTMVDETKINNFVLLGEDLETIAVSEKESPSDEDAVEQFEQKIQWFGLDFNYYLFAFVPAINSISKLEIKNNILRTGPIGPVTSFSYKVVFLKKNYDELKMMGHNLHRAVDFGMWGLVAVPLLRGLQYFFTIFNNYGLAIIFLTILVRFLTFPLQYKSFKSMKKMQVIQPELKKIKEKFKDNPQKQQQETMALFKKAGANPLGGCLPMVLQMPIFFAFYKVLFTSVELVEAPFYFWITDLSEKDPFYVLPVLMGLAMFLNMKITPSTTTDPAQQKIMMLMPVMFSVFMINLPAGLTLYILVSTIVGMLQQLFVFKRT